MKKILFIFLLLITSCISLKQDSRKLHRISQRHPEVIVEKCKVSFNSADSIHESIVYLPGITKYMDNFIEVNCDSIINSFKTIKEKKDINTSKFKVKCPPSKIIRDTVIKEKFIKEIDKASIYLLEKTKDSLSQVSMEQKTKIKTKNKTIVILGSILSLLAIWTLFKLYIKRTIGV
jgi:hypothetical protein